MNILLLMAALLLPFMAEMAVAAGSDSPPQPRTLIQHAALIITMDPKWGEGPLGTIADGDVLMAGDTIVAVGKHVSAPDAAVVDAKGKIVLPGFVDLHNHLVQSVIRGGCHDRDLNGWLHEWTWPAYEVLTPEDAYAAVRVSALDLIGTGVTTVVDWAGGLKFNVSREYVRALTESGIRFAYAPTPRKDEVSALKRLSDELIRPNPLATLQLAGATGMQHLSALTEAARLAREWGVKDRKSTRLNSSHLGIS